MENFLKIGKFIFRCSITLIFMGIGAGIFFGTDDNTLKLLGSNMVTAGWAAWVPTGTSELKKKVNDSDV